MKKMFHPDHGYHFAMSKEEEAKLIKSGWQEAPPKEKKPEPKPEHKKK